MDCDCLDLAIEEFRKAIQERPEDERRARTYGMHFLNYYPHRELGIIYYQRGQTEEAIKELEQSLHDSPSSKARYFLNQARKTWLLENGLDHFSPTIHLAYPKRAFHYTNQSEITIKGYVEDDRFVSGISINGKPIFIELSAQSIQFTQTFPLKWGRNSITITASDFLDRTAEKTLELVVDKTGPLINFSHSPLELAYMEGRMLIQGMVIDDSGVELLRINEKSIDLKTGEITEFSHWVTLTEDMHQISLLAKDIAGNETKGYIDLYSLAGFSQLFESFFERGEHRPKTTVQSKKGRMIRVAALDGSIPCLISSMDRKDISDRTDSIAMESLSKPSIEIDSLPKATIFNEIYLSGEIRYQKDISDMKILVNNKPIPMNPNDLDWLDKILSRIKEMFGKEEIKSLILSKIIELDLGQNEIVIEVCDDNGILRSNPIYIIRKKDEMQEQKYRLSAVVMPVNDISEIPWFVSFPWFSPSEKTKDYVFVKLNEALIKQKRFQIVDRKWLKQILFELKIAASDLVDKDKAIDVGRLVNSEAIISCYVRMQKGHSIELTGVMIDTETSLDIWSDDIYLPGDTDQVLAEVTEKLAMKIRQHFPLCKGKVLDRKRAKIKVDIGHNDGICSHTKLIVYREDEWDTRVLSNARVESVYDDYSRALLLNEEEPNEVDLKDLVITK